MQYPSSRSPIRRPALLSVLGLGALLLAAIAPLAGARAQQGEDAFSDSDYDGGWIGTVTQGKSSVPFQLTLNVEGSTAVGFLIVGDPAEVPATQLAVFAADFSKISAKQVAFTVDDAAPLRQGARALPGRFGTATAKLSYKAADDTLGGTFSGSLKGKVEAHRLDPDLPLQRLWQGSFKISGETIFVQLAPTEDADGTLAGTATFNGETSALNGQRQGSSVDMTFNLGGQEITFSGKLKTRNNKLKGAFESEGESNKATLTLADGNGKPMKFKKVQRLAAVQITPGQESTVSLVGKNIALGAVAFTDSSQVRVIGVDRSNDKSLSVTLAPSAGIAGGSSFALRLLNGDGEVIERSNVLAVAAGVDPDPVSFDAQIQPIFTTSCALSGCHNAMSAKAGMVLDASVSTANIVNVPSSQQPNLRRVQPGNPDDSYLVRKLEGGPDIDGGRMPKNRTPLPQAQIDLIRLWITQGANAGRLSGGQ